MRQPHVERSRVEFFWHNPPASDQGATVRMTVRGRVYERQVGPKDLLSLQEAAAGLGVHFSTVWRWAQSGKMKTVRRRGQAMISLTELKRLKEPSRGPFLVG